MGRIFLTFLLTLIPLHVYADITPCSTWSSGEDAETNCNAQAGCYYYPGNPNIAESPSCKACDAKHFGSKCVSLCSNATNASEYPGAGSDFPFAHRYMRPTTGGGSEAVRGARTKYECYKQLDGQPGNGHGEQCTERDGRAVTCRQYYRDAGTPSYYVKENVIINNQQSYYYIVCEDTDHNSPDLIETVGYHGEDTTCIDLNDNDDPTLYQYYCAKAYSVPLSTNNPHTVMRYHIETGEKCYSNALTCGKFDATGGCASANTNDISFSGYLRWNWDNKQWQQNINATAFTCKCTKNNIDIEVSGNDYTCTGDADYNASGTVYSPNTVEGTSVAYNDYPVGYSCESCKAGYVGFFKYANNDNRQKCVPAMKGCYSDGCNGDNCVSSSNNPGDTIPCVTNGTDIFADLYSRLSLFYHPCYAGMTTDNTGSTARTACHYNTDNTQFCDAYGCVSMDQLLNATGTSQNDWTWYMQQ